MTLSGYISGLLGLAKDIVRFCFALLKRPHYVAVLLILILGVFYFYGIPPREIPKVIHHKWQTVIADRKKIISEEIQSLRERMDDQDNPIKQTKDRFANQLEKENIPVEEKKEEPLFVLPDVSEQEKQLFEEKFGWQKALQASAEQVPNMSGKDSVHGILTVIGADQVQIADKRFSLKVKLRPGKAGEALPRLKRRFDGLEAQCFPDPSHPQQADCFVGYLGVSEMLIDFGYADPL